MAELFQKDVRTINEHLQNIYAEEELLPEPTIRKFRIVRLEGNREVARTIDHYNLEAIIAVGYRVRSSRGTQFRRWATDRLSEYLTKGFVMDDERLKNPPVAGSGVLDYFDELMERIRDIRASERRMYLRVREIFTMAADYKPSSKDATKFFQIIQNKLHFAATGKTAAENYLNSDKIDHLNRIVVMWLDFAEDQAKRRKQVFLDDWRTKLDQFLEFNDRDVLSHAGSISKQEADDYARDQYEAFAERRRALMESEGERNQIGALEDAAKNLPNHESD